MARKRNPETEPVASTGASSVRARRTKAAAKPKKHSPAVAADTPAAPAFEPEITALPAPKADYQPSHEEIARLAYCLWIERGCIGGSPEDDWFRAERELRLVPTAAATA